MTTEEWITSRRPTEADADNNGCVKMRQHPNASYGPIVHWSHVGEGVPWKHTGIWKTPEPAKPPTTTPRKFVAISRTPHELGYTIDAIDEDGVAWWMLRGSSDFRDIEWTQLTPLPAREKVQANG